MSFQVSPLVSITSFMTKGSISELCGMYSCHITYSYLLRNETIPRSFLDLYGLDVLGDHRLVFFVEYFLMIGFKLYAFGRNITSKILYSLYYILLGGALFQYVSLLMMFTVIT